MFKGLMKGALKNQKGMSLVEIVIALGLVGGGAVVLIKGKSLLSTGKKAQKVAVEKQLQNESLLKRGLFLLSDTTGDDGKRNQGICKMAYTTSTTAGVGQIFLNISKGKDVFNQKAWNNLADEWKPTGKENCKGLQGWSQCFEYQSDNEEMIASLEIIPVGINPYKSKGSTIFYPLNLNSKNGIDAKDVSFNIISRLHFSNKETSKTKILRDFIWAPSVGICDGVLNDNKNSPVKLSLSGAGASDPEGNTVYNRSGFTGNNEPVFSVNWRRSVAQAGITTDNGSFITTDKEKNIFGSCNEVAYRCPQLDSSKRVYGRLNMMLGLTYNSKADKKYAETETITPRFFIQKDSGRSLVNPKNVSFSFGKGNNLQEGRNFSVQGSNDMRISVDEGNGLNNQLCRQVCDQKSGFNTMGNEYKPIISLGLQNHKENFKFPTTQPLGCTACYMKSCSQYGIGTFGPMTEQPPQPQDSQFPECHLYEDKRLKNAALLSERDEVNLDTNSRCVKAKIEPSTGQLLYENADCEKNYPVMCYNFGEFILARDVIESEGSLSRVSYNAARKRCMQTAREVSGVEKLNEFLGVETTTIPTNEYGEYDFINIAQQGTFLAPQTQTDREQFIRWTKRNGLGTNEWFWVARYTEGKGRLRYLPPFAPKLTSEEKHALYYDPQGKLVHHEFPEELNIPAKETENATLLVHHIKFRGLFPAPKKNPAKGRKFPFLCKKGYSDGNFFLTKKESLDAADGGEYCRDEEGFFVPPTTPSQWVSALHLVSRFAQKFSYPWPKNQDITNIPMAWTALMLQGTTVPAQRKLKVHPSANLVNLGDMTNYQPDFTKDPYFLIDGKGFYVDPRPALSGKAQKESDMNKIKVKPGAKLIVRSSEGGKEEIKFNKGTTDKELSLDDIISTFNSATKFLKMTKKSDKGKVIVTIKSVNIVNNDEVRVFGGGLHSELGFSSYDKAQAPQSRYLCIEDGLRFKMEKYKNECSGQKVIGHDDIDEAMDISIGMTLMKFSHLNIFKLER